jgi:hypothetical protein
LPRTGSADLFKAVDAQTLGLLPWRDFFRESKKWPYRKKAELQLSLLRALSVEFGLGVNDWNDFHSLKINSKSDLRGYEPHNRELAIEYQTSGSSGSPFSFYRDRSLEAIDTAIFERAWSMVGRRDQLVLRLVSGQPKWAYYDSLRNVVPMNYRTIDKSYVEWVVKKRPFLIHGVAVAGHTAPFYQGLRA